MKTQERRQSERSDTLLIVEFRPLGSEHEYSTGISNNLSAGGFNFESSDVYSEPGDVLEFRLKHPRSEFPVEVPGEVVWKNYAWYKCISGAKFYKIDEEKKKQMSDLISAGGGNPSESYIRDYEQTFEKVDAESTTAAVSGEGSTDEFIKTPSDSIGSSGTAEATAGEKDHSGKVGKGDTKKENISGSSVLVAKRASGRRDRKKERSRRNRAWLIPVAGFAAGVSLVVLGMQFNKSARTIIHTFNERAGEMERLSDSTPAVQTDRVVKNGETVIPETRDETEVVEANEASGDMQPDINNEVPPLTMEAPDEAKPVTHPEVRSVQTLKAGPVEEAEQPPGEKPAAASEETLIAQPEQIREESSETESLAETEKPPVPPVTPEVKKAPVAALLIVRKVPQDATAKEEGEKFPETEESAIITEPLKSPEGNSKISGETGVTAAADQSQDDKPFEAGHEDRGSELPRYKDAQSTAVRANMPRIPNISLVVTGKKPGKPLDIKKQDLTAD